MDRDVELSIQTAAGARRIFLSAYLDADRADAAEDAAYAWIKALRRAPVDDGTFRDRVTYRGDSLWWFAEIFLHKERVASRVFQTIAALDALMRRERPSHIEIVLADWLEADLVRQAAARHGAVLTTTAMARRPVGQRARIAARGALYTMRVAASRLRPTPETRTVDGPVEVAAFVHAAFWRRDNDEDVYINPILDELVTLTSPGAVHLVGLGPRTNFRARRLRDRLAEFGDPSARGFRFTPIDAFTRRLSPNGGWRESSHVRRALFASGAIRTAASIDGYDVWPAIADALIGIVYLQFPWSARAIDEAHAALDALAPRVVVTYAEAGGWGRALLLAARQRGIPSVGLQHGFIYRHWLNYKHEPDEMAPSAANPEDRGFPRPDLTVVFDRFTSRYLEESGRFPAASLAVAGSPRLDAIVARARALSAHDLDALRQKVGARPGQNLIVVASKFTQIQQVFADLARVVASMPDVHLVVKCHPAETAEPYERAAAGAPNVSVAPASADLAAMIAAARALVTVNSTAAIEAMALEVPTLVVAAPSNLAPLVAAGAIAGVEDGDVGASLQRLIYDEERRTQLANARRAFMIANAIGSDGGAARRSAALILATARAGRAS